MKLYLSSYEYRDFEMSRKITHFQRMKLDNRNVLKIEVENPIIGQKYGLLGNNITTFYLVNRVDENAFEKLTQFPIDVHVLIVANSEINSPSSLEELQNIAWACLYDNEDDAKNHKIV